MNLTFRLETPADHYAVELMTFGEAKQLGYRAVLREHGVRWGVK